MSHSDLYCCVLSECRIEPKIGGRVVGYRIWCQCISIFYKAYGALVNCKEKLTVLTAGKAGDDMKAFEPTARRDRNASL